MLSLEEAGLKFLIVTKQYWCSGTDLVALKKEASRNGTFTKGEKRVYHGFLVHHETIVTPMGDLEFPSELAHETALNLGEI